MCSPLWVKYLAGEPKLARLSSCLGPANPRPTAARLKDLGTSASTALSIILHCHDDLHLRPVLTGSYSHTNRDSSLLVTENAQLSTSTRQCKSHPRAWTSRKFIVPSGLWPTCSLLLHSSPFRPSYGGHWGTTKLQRNSLPPVLVTK